MMSHCTICRAPTDLALSDVLTDKQINQLGKHLGGVQNIPLIGTCGERECVEKQLDREFR